MTQRQERRAAAKAAKSTHDAARRRALSALVDAHPEEYLTLMRHYLSQEDPDDER